MAEELEITDDQFKAFMNASKSVNKFETALNDLEALMPTLQTDADTLAFHEQFAQLLDILYEKVELINDEKVSPFDEMIRRCIVIADYELNFPDEPQTDSQRAVVESVRSLRKIAYLIFAFYHYQLNNYKDAIKACDVLVKELDYRDEELTDFICLYNTIRGCSHASLSQWDQANKHLEPLYYISDLPEKMRKRFMPAYAVTLHSIEDYGAAAKVYSNYLDEWKNTSDRETITKYYNAAKDESRDCFRNEKMIF